MNSFTFRTTLWFAGLVTGILIVVLSIGGWALNGQAIRGIEVLHALEADEVHEYLGPDTGLSNAEISDRIAQDADRDRDVFFIQVHDRNGAVRFRSANLGQSYLPDLSGIQSHSTIRLPAVGLVRLSEFDEGDWHIQVGSRLAPSQRVLAEYVRVAVVLVFGGAIGSIVLGWLFTRLIMKPIRAIEQTARRIGADNLSERIVVPAGRDELASLSRLLNDTFARIEAAFGQVRRFTADASHELKTPLALMRLNAEKMRDRLTDQGEPTGAVDDLLEEIERLNQIIEQLLFLSKAEGGVLKLPEETITLPTWLESWAEDAQVLAEDQGGRFNLIAEASGDLRGVPSLLRQLLFNLLTNALKFSPAGGLITLRVRRAAGRWEWVFEDEGTGLPADQLARIFDRFVRYERPVTGSQPAGHGLGLAICKSIVELHRGSIRAENREEQTGLRIVVILPAS